MRASTAHNLAGDLIAAGIYLAFGPSPLPERDVVLVVMNGRWQVRHRCR